MSFGFNSDDYGTECRVCGLKDCRHTVIPGIDGEWVDEGRGYKVWRARMSCGEVHQERVDCTCVECLLWKLVARAEERAELWRGKLNEREEEVRALRRRIEALRKALGSAIHGTDGTFREHLERALRDDK